MNLQRTTLLSIRYFIIYDSLFSPPSGLGRLSYSTKALPMPTRVFLLNITEESAQTKAVFLACILMSLSSYHLFSVDTLFCHWPGKNCEFKTKKIHFFDTHTARAFAVTSSRSSSRLSSPLSTFPNRWWSFDASATMQQIRFVELLACILYPSLRIPSTIRHSPEHTGKPIRTMA